MNDGLSIYQTKCCKNMCCALPHLA